MLNQSGKALLVLISLLLILGIGVYYFLKLKPAKLVGSPIDFSIYTYNDEEKGKPSNHLKDYSSKDLEVSLKYPVGWIVDSRYYEILIANFQTSLNSNKVPKSNEIEIIIHNARGCHKTIDENLKDPACGEGGAGVKFNEIVSKDTQEFGLAKFHKYLVKYSDGKEQRFYFLEKGERVLQIDKKPDPSVFEEEFESLVKSIKFLD